MTGVQTCALPIYDVIATLLPQAKDKGLELALEIGDTVPRVLAIDGFRLKQVLLNFISNAIKYTPKGKVTLKLEWADGWFDLAVQDTGPGMDAPTLERIFEPFFRLPGVSEKSGGVGLGLALVKSIAERHGWRVGCSDAPGGGACFSVWCRPQAQTVA